jgi:hypothetical protein
LIYANFKNPVDYIRTTIQGKILLTISPFIPLQNFEMLSLMSEKRKDKDKLRGSSKKKHHSHAPKPEFTRNVIS